MDVHRASELLGSGCEIKSMQTLEIIPRAVFAHRDHVDDPGRPGLWIDDRSSCNSDFGHHLSATTRVGSRLARVQQRYMPVNCARIRIERVDTIVFGGSEYHVGRADTRHRKLRNVQRLSIDLAIQRNFEQFAEGGRVYVRGREDRFGKILAGTEIIVMEGEYVCLTQGEARPDS